MLYATDGARVQVAILGPVRLVTDGRPLSVPRAQTRGMLALLALEPGRPLPHHAIIEAMWAGAPPEKARAQVHTALSVIRGLLATAGHADALESTRYGYCLAISPDSVDVGRFDRLTAAAERELDDGRAAQLWQEALALFQGEPLTDAAGAYIATTRAGIGERRLLAIEKLADVELRLGHHARVAAELMPVLSAQPHRERLRGRVMLALHGSGRQSEALALYHAYRRELSERDGLDPGRELADLAADILRTPAGPVERPSTAPTSTTPRPASVPAMLPAGGRIFGGREGYVAELERLAASGGVVAIDGLAGVGKTELALHWAHHTGQAFPDGRLYVNLRGFASEPVTPLEALGRLLFALGTPPAQLPPTLDDAVGLYRTLVADRRLLVLLDNARDADQVRPLLPGKGDSFVLITSRARLNGLMVSDGVQPVTLGVLDPAESRKLLHTLLGESDAAIGELAELCAGLPLALRIAAAAISTQHQRTAAQYVEDLRHGGVLSTLEVPGDESVAVRGAFDSSFSALRPTAARLFALLGLVPTQDLSTRAVAALAGQAHAAAIAELTRMHLVDEHLPGRFTLHDLLRLYARERAAELVGEDERRTALARLLGWYVERVRAAADVLYPEALRLPGPVEPQGELDCPSDADALALLRDEESNLVALIGYAAAHGPFAAAWQLADALRAYLSSRASTTTWLTVASHGLTAAQKEGDAFGQIAAYLNLAHLYVNNGRYPEAMEKYRQALALSREAGWREAELAALGNLGTVNARLCRLAEAAECQEQALAVATQLGQHARRAVILGNLGGIKHRQGMLREAAEAMAQALSLHRELGAVGGQALQLNNMGIVLRELGRLDEAGQALDEALALYQSMNNAAGAGMVVCSLADLQRDRGALGEALALALRAQAMPELAGNDEHIAAALNSAGAVHSLLSDHDNAVEAHQRACGLAREVGNQELEAESLIGLAVALARAGRPRDGARHAREALAIGKQTGHGLLEALALTALAESLRDAGDRDEAAAVAAQAREAHRATGHHAGLTAVAVLSERLAG